MMREGFVWLPEFEMGYYPVKDDSVYDRSYFDKYTEYSHTQMGKDLTKARIEFVDRFHKGFILDIGIGCGDFVQSRNNTEERKTSTRGFDINPAGKEWLEERNLFSNAYEDSIKYPAMTFWDSLEHIENPDILLKSVREWVFVSLPIFAGVNHILTSKHFRKDEHRWYWTNDGFIDWMMRQGFEMHDHTYFEQGLGREDIHTYAFKRVR